MKSVRLSEKHMANRARDIVECRARFLDPDDELPDGVVALDGVGRVSSSTSPSCAAKSGSTSVERSWRS